MGQNNPAYPVTLLHVLEQAKALTDMEYRKQLAARVQRELLRLVPDGEEDVCPVDTMVTAGTPFYEILKTLKREKIDLLVMNTHGKGMLHRVMLGSTTERVVRAAECPVVLIPPAKRTIQRKIP
jgi:nucleotide-binding universal stress UspA family protein